MFYRIKFPANVRPLILLTVSFTSGTSQEKYASGRALPLCHLGFHKNLLRKHMQHKRSCCKFNISGEARDQVK